MKINVWNSAIEPYNTEVIWQLRLVWFICVYICYTIFFFKLTDLVMFLQVQLAIHDDENSNAVLNTRQNYVGTLIQLRKLKNMCSPLEWTCWVILMFATFLGFDYFEPDDYFPAFVEFLSYQYLQTCSKICFKLKVRFRWC